MEIKVPSSKGNTMSSVGFIPSLNTFSMSLNFLLSLFPLNMKHVPQAITLHTKFIFEAYLIKKKTCWILPVSQCNEIHEHDNDLCRCFLQRNCKVLLSCRFFSENDSHVFNSVMFLLSYSDIRLRRAIGYFRMIQMMSINLHIDVYLALSSSQSFSVFQVLSINDIWIVECIAMITHRYCDCSPRLIKEFC